VQRLVVGLFFASAKLTRHAHAHTQSQSQTSQQKPSQTLEKSCLAVPGALIPASSYKAGESHPSACYLVEIPHPSLRSGSFEKKSKLSVLTAIASVRAPETTLARARRWWCSRQGNVAITGVLLGKKGI